MEGQEDKKRGNFFMVPNELVKSGLWAKMKPSEQAVYNVLCYFANPNSGLAYPTVAKISELSGVKMSNVCKATKQLCQYGLISKKIAKIKLKFRVFYRVFKNPEIDPVTIPWKREKYQSKRDEKTGKFLSMSPKRESDTMPLKRDSTTMPLKRAKIHTYPDIKRLALRDTTSQIHLGKEKKKFKERLEEEMNKALPCGEKEFEKFKREIETKLKGENRHESKTAK